MNTILGRRRLRRWSWRGTSRSTLTSPVPASSIPGGQGRRTVAQALVARGAESARSSRTTKRESWRAHAGREPVQNAKKDQCVGQAGANENGARLDARLHSPRPELSIKVFTTQFKRRRAGTHAHPLALFPAPLATPPPRPVSRFLPSLSVLAFLACRDASDSLRSTMRERIFGVLRSHVVHRWLSQRNDLCAATYIPATVREGTRRFLRCHELAGQRVLCVDNQASGRQDVTAPGPLVPPSTFPPPRSLSLGLVVPSNETSSARRVEARRRRRARNF